MLSGDCSFAFKTVFRAPSGPYRFGHHPCNRHWCAPVHVWQSGSVRRAISSVEEAAVWLLDQWPEKARGRRAHLAARRACLAALGDKIEGKVARQAFIRAAREAGSTSSCSDSHLTV